jgi:hypothetical protein
VRAVIDVNGNRALDRSEAFDTLTVDVPLNSPIELRTAPRDTLPPRLATVSASDSVSLRVTFDHPLDPTQQISPDMFVLAGEDSVHLAIARVLTPAQEMERTRLTQKAIADSTRRADSLAGKVLPPPPRPATPAATAPRKPLVPAPFNNLLIELAKPLAPETRYRLTARGVRGINGLQTESERTFNTPKPPPPPPPRDSTARPTSTAKPPHTP